MVPGVASLFPRVASMTSSLLVDLHPAQPEGVAHDGHGGERHRRRREHGIQKSVLSEQGLQRLGGGAVREERVQDTGGNRDERDVVGEGPEQVLLYVSDRGLREIYGAGDAAHVAGDQGQVGGLHRDVGARAYGDAYLGLRESGSVIDAVADPADLLAFGLESLYFVRLVLREDLGEDPVYAQLAGDGPGGPLVVARDHGDLEPQSVQPVYSLARLLLHRVGHGDYAREFSIHRDEHGRLARGRQLLEPGLQTVFVHPGLAQEPLVPDEDGATLDPSPHAATAHGAELLRLGESEPA